MQTLTAAPAAGRAYLAAKILAYVAAAAVAAAILYAASMAARYWPGIGV